MTKVGRMSSGTCTCEARTEGKCAKPRCMIKGSARDEWGRSSSVAHGVVLVARVRGAGIYQNNRRVPELRGLRQVGHARVKREQKVCETKIDDQGECKG